MLRHMPALAYALRPPPVVWRIKTGFRHDEDTSAADVIRYERQNLRNAEDFNAALLNELDQHPASALLWVTFARADALRHADAANVAEFRLDIPAFVFALDGDGRFLLFFPDDDDADSQQFGGAAMTQTDDPTCRPPPDRPAEPITATPTPAPQEDDEERRKGRGGAGLNPAFATLAHNIRPDVVDTPAGLGVVTAAKNADYLAKPKERELRPFHPDVVDAPNLSDRLRAKLVGREERFGSEGDTRQHEPFDPRSLEPSLVDALREKIRAAAQGAEPTPAPSPEPDSASAALAAKLAAAEPQPAAQQAEPLERSGESVADKAAAFEAAFENYIRNGDSMTAEFRAKLSDMGMLDDNGNMKGHYFEHLDAGGAFDSIREDFATRYAARIDDEPQPTRDEPVTREANEQSTKRQEAERAAAAGESRPERSDDDVSANLAAKLERLGKAAEREAEGEAREAGADLDPTEGHTPTGGRGFF